MTFEELHQKTLDRIEAVYRRVEEHYGMNFPRPQISFQLKGRRAGVAYYRENLIKLNRQLLAENGDKFILDTPGHEAAHLVARRLFGGFIKSHGNEWKSIMRIIGQEPTRCHEFEVKTNHVYSCACNPSNYISTYYHNRSVKGAIILRCKKCKTKLSWNKLTVA